MTRVKMGGSYPGRYKDEMGYHPLLIVDGAPVRYRTVEVATSPSEMLRRMTEINVTFTNGDDIKYIATMADMALDRRSGRASFRVVTK